MNYELTMNKPIRIFVNIRTFVNYFTNFFLTFLKVSSSNFPIFLSRSTTFLTLALYIAPSRISLLLFSSNLNLVLRARTKTPLCWTRRLKRRIKLSDVSRSFLLTSIIKKPPFLSLNSITFYFYIMPYFPTRNNSLYPFAEVFKPSHQLGFRFFRFNMLYMHSIGVITVTPGIVVIDNHIVRF